MYYIKDYLRKQYFPGKTIFKVFAKLNLKFQITNTCNKCFARNQIFVFVWIAWIHILFSQMKKVKLVKYTILTSNHGLLLSYTTQKVYFLVRNQSYRTLKQFIFKGLVQLGKLVTQIWRVASAELQNIHYWWCRLEYFVKAGRSKSLHLRLQLSRNHTHFF